MKAPPPHDAVRFLRFYLISTVSILVFFMVRMSLYKVTNIKGFHSSYHKTTGKMFVITSEGNSLKSTDSGGLPRNKVHILC